MAITTATQKIVNARIMTELAVQFNIGADIFGKGNRHIESKLGAENMSGDTVMVPIYDGGEVYDQIDISNEELGVKRDAVPVTVRPLTTAAALSQEDLTLAIKEPEIMGKRVAKMALEAQTRAVKFLEGAALNGTKILTADITANDGTRGFVGRNKLYDLFALCEASKLAGETYGVVHPMVWSKLIAMFQGNYAPADKVGGDLYKNELGELAGIKWSKTELLKTITGKTISETVTLDYQPTMTGYDVQAPMQVPTVIPGPTVSATNIANFFPATGNKVGDLSLPFTLADGDGNVVYSTDIFGNSTGRALIQHFVATGVNGETGAVTSAVFAQPIFFEGARVNAFCDGYVNYNSQNPGDTAKLTLTATNFLDNAKTFLPPALVWKRDDFLIAAKGLEKFIGSDALTIPTQYKDKGYLPLRGWAFTLPLKGVTTFRVDVLLGMGAYTRTSMNALYIEA